MLRPLPTPLRLALMLVVMAMLLARGWMGQAMAMEMAMNPATAHASTPRGMAPAHHAAASGGHDAAAQASSGHAHVITAVEPPPCHGSATLMAQATPDAPESHHTSHATSQEDSHDTSHCGTCTLCQVCHSVAMTDDAATGSPFALPQAAPLQPAPRFASAEPHQGFKPPIS
ncbi:MAG: hypothetical protein KA795_04335 [Burkholderiaceae bacterium]|nr:hypothetical protein [Burkholderiaceae bacterium]